MTDLTAVVLTKNEEENIERCLASLSFCSEVLVVDDESDDNTVYLARKYSKNIYVHPSNNDLASQRNFALSKSRGKWVLFIDADEEVTDALAEEITDAVNGKNGFVGYFIKRKDIFQGKILRFGETASIKLLRLAKKNAGMWERKVHEVWKVKGTKAVMKNELIHHSHKSIYAFLRNINRWSAWHALENSKEGKQANIAKVIIWPVAKFKLNYIFRLGFLDGTHGFVFAMMMSFHSFLSWSNLWLTKKEKY